MTRADAPADTDRLAAWVRDAHAHHLALVDDLADEQFEVPRRAILNPFLWEMGHVAWFQETWVLRRPDSGPSIVRGADALYDSATVPHDTRWTLTFPTRSETLAFADDVTGRVLQRLERGMSAREAYYVTLSAFHHDMHGEALAYMRQTLGYPAPARVATGSAEPSVVGERIAGDAEIPGGEFRLGSEPSEPFVFDNEKWAHTVRVAPFAIARVPVAQEEFAAFVDDGGYARAEWWTADGWAWRERARAEHPVYWRRSGQVWERRDFDRWVPLEPRRPVVHVNAHEAEAWCRWTGRRLPTEVEWEVAACAEPAAAGESIAPRKRRYPWADDDATAARANLDARTLHTVDVDMYAAGDSAWGCRQMLGNVWEWTASAFCAYPGFVADPYREYSAPWFGSTRVLRGGCWATRARLVHPRWRNFFPPHRRDIVAGFRTCRLDG